MIPHTHESILYSKALAFVATTDAKGRPNCSPVWFEWTGETLRFSTTKVRRKAHNLSRNPEVSVVIADLDDSYRYIEMRGSVTIADDPGREFINKMSMKYAGKPFPDRPGEERVIVSLEPSFALNYPK